MNLQYPPAITATVQADPARMTVRYTLTAHLQHTQEVSPERLQAEEALDGILATQLRQFQTAAIQGLGLEQWRDEHRAELEAEARRERQSLVRALYSAVRQAPDLAAAQLILADEVEAQQ